MSARVQIAAIFAFLTLWDGAAGAQVGKVAIQTTGISCGVCAAISEVQFRRMPGVDKVAISLSTETITLFYNSDASFDPRQIRRILQPLEVGVVRFQLSARGKVLEDGTKS